MRSSPSSYRPPRQGMILLVVVLMLALFLVVGLTFVYYSESASTSSRIFREAQTPDPADIAPETLLSYFLGQFIYPVPDDINGAQSAMRGHELARLMYGWHPVTMQNNPLVADPTHTNNPWDTTPSAGYSYFANTTAFNGFGPFRQNPAPQPFGVQYDYDFPNYTWFKVDNFVRDPERVGIRSDPTQPLKQYAGGFNPPYTYPDRANMFLAAIMATDPTTHQPLTQPRIIIPSFGGRNLNLLPYHSTNANSIQLDPATSGGQTFWTSSNAAYKYLTLRPRPADMYYNGPNDPKSFPLPGDAGGDVKQLPGVPFVYTYTANGQQVQVQMQNDSSWMDLGYPVQITRNGRKFKPLFAVLALPLDGRLNLNVHGNINSGQGTPTSPFQHASNQGLARHEINLSKVLNVEQFVTPTAIPVEWRQLYMGTTTAPTIMGRYGSNFVAGYNQTAANNLYPDPYVLAYTNNTIPATNPPATMADLHRSLIFPLDFDAVDAAVNGPRPVTTHFALPMQTAAGQPSFANFPYFAPPYDNYRISTAANSSSPQNPLLNHPLLDQMLRSLTDDMRFGDDNMYYLMAGDYRKSSLYNVIPQNLGYNPQAPSQYSTVFGNKTRMLVGVRNYDLDVPAASPWVTDPITTGGYTLKASAQPPDVYPNQAGTAPPIVTPAPAAVAAQQPTGDFKPGDGRANLLSRLDLNRKLVSYRDPTTGMVTPTQATLAIQDRQRFAKDVFDRLVKATGAVPPATTSPAPAGTLSAANGATADHYSATRWLAQLAANIVDYIDDDDFSTPFNWNPIPDAAISGGDSGWVFGVEAPKLVINEIYAELQNDPTDTTAAVSGAKLPFQYNFWLELYNPMSVATPPTALSKSNPPTSDRQDPDKGGQDRNSTQLQRTSATLNSNYPAYQIQIVDETKSPPTFLAQPGNMDGSVNPQGVVVQVTSYLPDLAGNAQAPAGAPTPYPDYTFVQPNIGQFNIPTNAGGPPSNTGFFIIGPDSKHPMFQPGQNQAGGGGVTMRPTMNLQDQGTTPQRSAQTPWGQPTDPTTGKPGAARNALTYQYQGPLTQTTVQPFVQRTHTAILRRLACPSMDPNPLIQDPTTKAWSLMNPALPANPYVTIDYVANVPTNDAVQYTSQKPVIPNKPNNTDYMQPSSRYSIGRIQPYAASLTKKQTSANPNPTNNTFFQHNSPTLPPGGISAEKGGPMDYPFDWLVFLDRPLTNITEILNVPGTTPPQLTQRFVVGQKDAQGNISNEQRQQHLAPWGDQNARIYRALEFFTVGDRSPYPGTDGRVAGKIDINAVFDYDIANAFIDAQANSNFFTQQAVSDVWLGNGTLTDPNNTSFLSRKQVLMGLGNGTLPDKPFMSFAAPVVAANSDPQYPATAFPTGVGIANTILPHPVPAAAQGGQPTLGGTFTPQTTPPNGTPASITYTPPVPGQAIPPYIVDELLTKVSGHVTTRSNNFAVFVTVGFFEVMDDTTVPVKLGAELTTSSGKVIRHQMFAVVDRTNLAIDAGAALDGDVMGRLRQAPNPPTFMSLADEIVANPVRQGQTVTPINISVNGGLPTDYDGTAPVSFKTYQAPPKSAPALFPTVGTYQWMFLDTGIYQEPVQVTLSQTGTQLQLVFPNGPQYNHAPGAMLCTYQPGNPGPQGPIDYGSSQFRAVVPFTYIVQ